MNPTWGHSSCRGAAFVLTNWFTGGSFLRKQTNKLPVCPSQVAVNDSTIVNYWTFSLNFPKSGAILTAWVSCNKKCVIRADKPCKLFDILCGLQTHLLASKQATCCKQEYLWWDHQKQRGGKQSFTARNMQLLHVAWKNVFQETNMCTSILNSRDTTMLPDSSKIWYCSTSKFTLGKGLQLTEIQLNTCIQ